MAGRLLDVLPRLWQQWCFRVLGRPHLPFSLVLSVTYRCNSRCLTCNVWRKGADAEVCPYSEELSLEEWRRIFAHLGRTPLYLTFSGGEPFLRRDLADIVISAYEVCRPSAITIPTNGLLPERVMEETERIAAACRDTNVGLNLSLDGLGEQHDRIRGVPGNWERAMRTWEGLKSLGYPNLTLSIHTVISRFNVADFPQIQEGLRALQPDSYITEIAEQRRELDTLEANIAPTAAQYRAAMETALKGLERQRANGFAAVTQAFRARYYGLAERTVREERQVIPCYAGWASGHIAPDGDVWTCCTRAEPTGNLRQSGYDLWPIWFGERAEALRASIRRRECWCPMANAAYTNMLLHPESLLYVARVLAGRRLGGRLSRV